MHLKDRIKLAREHANLSQEVLAQELGAEHGSRIGNYEQGRREPSLAELEKIARICRVRFAWLAANHADMLDERLIHISNDETPEDYILLQQLSTEASAGKGCDVENVEIVSNLSVLKEWAEENFGRKNLNKIKVITARGNSMIGAGIKNGDLLFVDPSVNRYEDDGYYVFTHQDRFFIKRLRLDVIEKKIKIISYEDAVEQSRTLSREEGEGLYVQGKVLAWWTMKK